MYSEKNLILLVIGAIEREAEVGYQEGGEVLRWLLSAVEVRPRREAHTPCGILAKERTRPREVGAVRPTPQARLELKLPLHCNLAGSLPVGGHPKSAQPLNGDEHMANMGDFVLICAHSQDIPCKNQTPPHFVHGTGVTSWWIDV